MRRRLPGCSFLGIVEAALYTNVGVVRAKTDRAVSWHVHLLVWGISEKRLDALIGKANRHYETLVPGVTPGHYRGVKSKGVEAQTYYMFKGLINAYRIWAPKRTVVDRETGEITKEPTGSFEQAKDDLRPGDHARMVRVMANQTIDQLAFAAGRGEALLAAINREALAPFERSEKERSFHRGPPQPLQAHRPPSPPLKVGPPKPVRRPPPAGKPSGSRSARLVMKTQQNRGHPSRLAGKSLVPRPARPVVRTKLASRVRKPPTASRITTADAARRR